MEYEEISLVYVYPEEEFDVFKFVIEDVRIIEEEKTSIFYESIETFLIGLN